MAAGFPTKVTYANGDVFSASDINDTNGTINLINPSAKGDLFAGSAANTYTKLAVGANDTVLTADSTAATGMKWATPSTGALVLVKSQTIGSAVSSVTVTNAFSSAYDAYKIVIGNGGSGSTNITLQMQLDSNTANYYSAVALVAFSGGGVSGSGNNNIGYFNRVGSASTSSIYMDIDLINPFVSTHTTFQGHFTFSTVDAGHVGGLHTSTSSFTGFTINCSAGTLTGGKIYVYGYKNS
jgi:hypothetical protein